MSSKTIVRAVSVLTAVILIFGIMVFPINAATEGITLSGTCHVQNDGDTEGSWDASTGTLTLGTRGQSKRVESITVNLMNNTGLTGTLRYRVHVQNIGWQEYKQAGSEAGTRGRALRLEGIEMELTGELASSYSVEYAVHIEDYGDAQGFVSDGTLAGTTGESKRLEEVRIRIVPKASGTSTSVNYRVHRQDFGWENKWVSDGALSGTTGQSKRLEGIEIHLTGNQYEGSVTYRTHVQNIGWEEHWSSSGEMSGTQGMSYRLEGIEIKLTGDIANHYDIYYRVHAQDYGWLGWAKNGEMSGTSGQSKRLEAIQIVLVAKGGAVPGDIGGVISGLDTAGITPSNLPPSNLSPYWVRVLPEALSGTTDQLVIVSCDGMNSSTATVSMHIKNEQGVWIQLFATPGYVGRKGLVADSERVEGCKRTPIGTYRFTMAFGNANDPGSVMPYTKITSDLYWSGDWASGMHYNEMVSINDYPNLDKSNSEHLINYTKAYQYCLNIGFNEEGTPGRGCAIFLHCFGNNRYTSGCVAIAKERMVDILRTADEDCLIIINTRQALGEVS
ncbi:MAG: hypothetical protein K5745_07595 [Saccharofermentans sp.]|nr:hypothetical protein [Saccharofermentans sp.]